MSFGTLFSSFTTERRTSQASLLPTLPNDLFKTPLDQPDRQPHAPTDGGGEGEMTDDDHAREEMAANWKQVSEACPRARWRVSGMRIAH